MKGLNKDVRRTRLVIPSEDEAKAGVGVGAHALLSFCCTYLSCLMPTQDVVYRCN